MILDRVEMHGKGDNKADLHQLRGLKEKYFEVKPGSCILPCIRRHTPFKERTHDENTENGNQRP